MVFEMKKDNKKNKRGTILIVLIAIALFVLGLYSIVYNFKKAGKAAAYSEKILQLYITKHDVTRNARFLW